MISDRAIVKRVSRPVAAMLLLTGCFHYVPAQGTPPPKPETEVRVTLADPMDIHMGEFTLHEVNRIDGIVAEVDGDTLGLVARWLYPRIGGRYDALFGSYNVSVAGIAQLEEWRFSGKRTVIAVGLGAVVTTVLLHSVWRVIRGDQLGDRDIPPQSVVAPR